MSQTFLFQAIRFCQTVAIQIIQFNISIIFVYTQLNFKTILFRTFQSSVVQYQYLKQFYFKQFSLAYVHCLFLFDPLIGPYHVLPHRARVNLGAMAMNGCSAFCEVLASLGLIIILFCIICRRLVGGDVLTSRQKCSQSILLPQRTG